MGTLKQRKQTTNRNENKMGLIKPDFTDVVEITPAVYSARITDSNQKVSKAGNDYTSWTLEIFAAEDERLNGRHLYYMTMHSGKMADRLKRLVKAVTGEDISGEFDTTDLHGRELKAVVIDGDRGYPEVKSVSANT